MKKLLPCFTLVGLLVLALGGTTGAKPATLTSLATTVAGTSTDPSIPIPVWAAPAGRIGPTVTAVGPASALNDIDTPVVITGAGFTPVMDGMGTVVVTSPTASLGSTALTNVTWVNSTTLTATVPWGIDPGVYALGVVNPDGGTGSLVSAFTVTQGIGKWNGGDLYGGPVLQVMLKPGDPNTLYAVAADVGAFRSRDAGEHWSFFSGEVGGQAPLVLDPLHPAWLYAYVYGRQDGDGLFRSTDEGDTWTQVLGQPGGGGIAYGGVFPSPHDPQVLFLAYSGWDSSALGLIKSTNGGVSWKVVTDVRGISVQAVAYHPTDPLKMVLATTAGRVYQSTDGGDRWSEVLKPPLGDIAVIAYNPYRPTEVWIASTPTPAGHYKSTGGIHKSTGAAFASWLDVSSSDIQPHGTSFVTFTGADSVHIAHFHSADGGTSWQPFGPPTGGGEISFDPNDPRIGYVGDSMYGVQKTTDGGGTWAVKNQGLAAMYCNSIVASGADPLRVFATFVGWPGIYRSDDGTANWTYNPLAGLAGCGELQQLCEDPFDPQRLYAAASNGLYVSTDGGTSWSNLGWNTPSSTPNGRPPAMAPDPHVPGHLLVSLPTGAGTVRMYSSSDHGVSWQPVTMPQDMAGLVGVSQFEFDPETPGLVYLATPEKGVWRSTDSGETWQRIDDRRQPHMAGAAYITIATHPQHILFVGTEQGPFRSFDGGATWERAQNPPSGTFGYLFAGGDSARLYAATAIGLFLSSNGGDTWTRAAGVLGRLRVSVLDAATASDRTILYAATTGGDVGATGGSAGKAARTAHARTSTLVKAGIYRYVQLPAPKVTLKLSGLKKGAVTLGKGVTAKGKVTPRRFAGSKVKLTVQKKRGAKWVTLKSVTRTSSAKGAYSWRYRPAKGGSYRLQATVAKTTRTAAAKTQWRTFKVR